MKQLCSVDLRVSKEGEEYFRKIILSLANKFSTLPFDPHITLYGNLNMEISTLDSIITPIFAEIEPFTIEVSTIGYTEKKGKTLFFDFKASQEMESIFLKVKQALFPYATYDFQPHLSITYKNDLAEEDKKLLIEEIPIKSKVLIDTYAIVTTKSTWDDLSSWETVRKKSFDIFTIE